MTENARTNGQISTRTATLLVALTIIGLAVIIRFDPESLNALKQARDLVLPIIYASRTRA